MLAAFLTTLAVQAAAPIEAGWLEGCWEGEGFGLPATECWMRAPSGRMTGVFQLLNADGTQRFSEIFVLDTFEDGPALRLKHFDPDLTGWEAQDAYVSFALIEQGDHHLVFDGLEIRLEDDRLLVDVTVSGGDETRVERFTYARVGQGAR